MNAIAEAVVRRGAAPMTACGFAVRRGAGWVEGVSSDGNHLFDLASLTKPVTALAVASLPGLLDTALGDALPKVADAPSAPHPMAHLLGHRAGLDAHVPLFLPAIAGARVERDEALREAARALRPDARPAPESSDAVYSDLGYVLAGEALAHRVGAADAGDAVRARVLEPLGLSTELGSAASLRAQAPDADDRFVPTEAMAWRGGVSRGAVHDDNAWVLTGHGASGHAGLFGTVHGVLRLGEAVVDGWVGREGPLAPLPFDRLLAEVPGTTWRMGFDGKAKDGPSTAGATASPRSVGHLGFTGTSLWIDPDRVAITVLLTNRVHPSRDRNALRDLRGPVHDALFALADRA